MGDGIAGQEPALRRIRLIPATGACHTLRTFMAGATDFSACAMECDSFIREIW